VNAYNKMPDFDDLEPQNKVISADQERVSAYNKMPDFDDLDPQNKVISADQERVNAYNKMPDLDMCMFSAWLLRIQQYSTQLYKAFSLVYSLILANQV